MTEIESYHDGFDRGRATSGYVFAAFVYSATFDAWLTESERYMRSADVREREHAGRILILVHNTMWWLHECFGYPMPKPGLSRQSRAPGAWMRGG